jgi:hypothetical protein
MLNNKHNNRLTLNNELERTRISCQLDLLNNNIMHEYNMWLIGDDLATTRIYSKNTDHSI